MVWVGPILFTRVHAAARLGHSAFRRLWTLMHKPVDGFPVLSGWHLGWALWAPRGLCFTFQKANTLRPSILHALRTPDPQPWGRLRAPADTCPCVSGSSRPGACDVVSLWFWFVFTGWVTTSSMFLRALLLHVFLEELSVKSLSF